MAFIYAGDDLLSHTRVGRTLLSAKSLPYILVQGRAGCQSTAAAVGEGRPRKKIKFKSSGQECPLHTGTAQLLLATAALICTISLGDCSFVTDSKNTYGLNGRGKPKGSGQECPLYMIMAEPLILDRKYEYRRRLPHYQKANRAILVTFCKFNREPLPAQARDVVLEHCLHDRGKRIELHAAVVMPDHVHLLLTPLRDEKGWPYGLPAILKLIKGTSARSVNKLLGSSGPVWQEESFDHVVRSSESFDEKLDYIRQNPVVAGLVSRAEEYRWLWIEERS